MLKVLGNKEDAAVLVIGCFHGDEPQGARIINRYLLKYPDTNILFIPCLNEYGYEHNVRTNENGVDLNRNFPTKNWIYGDIGDFYGGFSPASEVQTKFVIEVVKKYNPQLIVTLHAPYCIVNYDGDAADIAEDISEIIGYPVQKSIGYETPGSFGTWAGIENNIPTITLELDEKAEFSELLDTVFDVFNYLEYFGFEECDDYIDDIECNEE